jgi:hypothetical protein
MTTASSVVVSWPRDERKGKAAATTEEGDAGKEVSDGDGLALAHERRASKEALPL